VVRDKVINNRLHVLPALQCT